MKTYYLVQATYAFRDKNIGDAVELHPRQAAPWVRCGVLSATPPAAPSKTTKKGK